MNLPNKLTMFRVILIPFFVVFLLVDITPVDKWIALAVFIIASLTDMLDLSLLENAGHLGLPIPEKLKDILAQLHDKAEKGDE